jgi:maltodextrin utilization protein YvdJ
VADILALNAGFGLVFAKGYNYRSCTLTVRICIATSKVFLACLFMLSFYVVFLCCLCMLPLHVVFAQGMTINVARTDTHQMSFTTSDASYIACCIGM